MLSAAEERSQQGVHLRERLREAWRQRRLGCTQGVCPGVGEDPCHPTSPLAGLTSKLLWDSVPSHTSVLERLWRNCLSPQGALHTPQGHTWKNSFRCPPSKDHAAGQRGPHRNAAWGSAVPGIPRVWGLPQLPQAEPCKQLLPGEPAALTIPLSPKSRLLRERVTSSQVASGK